MSRPPVRPSTSSREPRLNNAIAESVANDMAFDDKSSSMTHDDAASPETRPASPTSQVHVQQEPTIAVEAKNRLRSRQQTPSPTSSRTLKGKKLQGHADQSSDRKQPQESKRTKKTSWDPLARYHSDANSFPDYGSPNRSHAMGLDRLKLINGSTGPVNTLGSRRFDAHDTNNTPPAKRQKQEFLPRIHGHTASPFFSKANPARSDDVQEVVKEASQDDSYDIKSTSSAGHTASLGATLAEYRNAQPKGRNGPGRLRKSRSSMSSQAQWDSFAKTRMFHDSGLATHSMGQSTSVMTLDSSDDLAEDPPPANVTSDLVKQHSKNKRERPYQLTDSVEPQIKRHKPPTQKEPIDVSEDELQADSPNDTKSYKKPTILSTAVASFASRAKARSSRGDIQPTAFQMHMDSSGKSQSRGMGLTRAVCGKKLYERDDTQGRISLCRSQNHGTRLEAKLQDGQKTGELSWLGVDLDHIHTYSTAPSRTILVNRSQSGEAGPKLYLEFESREDTEKLVRMLNDKGIRTETPSGLEKMFEIALDRARNYTVSNGSAEERTSSRRMEHGKDKSSWILAPQSPPENPETSPRAEKLKDRLIQSARETESQSGPSITVRRSGPETRRSTRTTSASVPRQQSPDLWTDLNPGWQKNWQKSLVFPATGKNRATVDKDDIPRLDEGEFLNDNLISFYLRYLQVTLEKERPELLNKVYFFSTFFFEKLRSTKGKINYEGVKAWTAKVDLFSYDYIVVPVNEHAHWYVAIVCNAPNAIREPKEPAATGQANDVVEVLDVANSPRMSTVEREMSDVSLRDGGVTQNQTGEPAKSVAELSSTPSSPSKKRKSVGATGSKTDPTQPKIITLDSLGSSHTSTCKALREYLAQEAKAKKEVDLTIPPTGLAAIGIPQQDNFCDCGVFVLGYMQEFLKDPDEAARKLLQKEKNMEWVVRPSELRNSIRTLLFDLQKEQQERLDKEAQLRKSKKKSAGGRTLQSSPIPAPAMRPPSPAPRLPGAFPTSPQKQPEPEIIVPSSEIGVEEVSAPKPPENGVDPNPPCGKLGTYKWDEEPKFISPLAYGSNASPNTDERHRTVTSSPIRKSDAHHSKLVVELKSSRAGEKLDYDEPIPLDGELDLVFVKGLSSAASESQGAKGRAKKDRRPSIEVIDTKKKKPRPSPRSPARTAKVATEASPFFRPLPSVETEEVEEIRRSPKYDGIDRSVDLTIS